VTLGATTNLSGSTVTFLDKIVGGANGLTVTGNAVFGDAAADTVTGLSSLHVTGSSGINTNTVTTTGTQAYDGAVSLGTDTTLSGNGVSFSSTVNGARALSVVDAGSTTFGGAVGGGTPLTSLTVSGGGTTTINGSISTSGASGVNLTGVNLAINAAITTTGGGGVTIGESGTVTSAAAGDIVAGGAVSITSGGSLTSAGDIGGTAVSVKGLGLGNSGVISGTTSVTVDAGSGILTNTGTITNGGAGSTAPVVLKGDGMSLAGGAITGHAAPVTLTAGTAGQAISLIAGGGLMLTQADLNTPTTTGGLIVGDPLHTADITVGGTVTTPTGASGGFTINAGYDGIAGGSGGRILDSGGLINVAGNVTLKAYGNVGDPGPAVAPVHLGSSVTGLATLSETGNIYGDKVGALVITGVNNPLGSVTYTASGAITQTGAMIANTLNATVTGAGGITLQDPTNNVTNINMNAPGALAYYQNASFTVAQALGTGMTLGSGGSILLQSLSPTTPLNINAGSGDVTLSTVGAISITGPGSITAHNISLTFPSTVSFAGGSTAGASNDLTIKATGNIDIQAQALTVTGGTTTATASGQNLTNDVVIQAGGHLGINVTHDFSLSGGTANSTAGSVAQANSFLKAQSLDITVGGNFLINGGTANPAGGEANASAIVLATGGKGLNITGDLVLTGGKITSIGPKATAFAIFDPELTLEIKTGGSVAVVGGSAPAASPNLLASASIQNAGPIKFTIGGSGTFTHPDPVVAGILGPGIKAGLIVAGGKGSGLFDVFDNPVTSNDYPIKYVFTGGGAFTVITDMTGYADALVKSRAPLGVDESLMAYINFAINTETLSKGRRGAADQGNFKRKTAGQCT